MSRLLDLDIALAAGLSRRCLVLRPEPSPARRSAGPVRYARCGWIGIITPICGDFRTMPALGFHPAVERIDVDADGDVVGLSSVEREI